MGKITLDVILKVAEVIIAVITVNRHAIMTHL